MDVNINYGCFGTGFKSLFKRNLNSYRKEEEHRKQQYPAGIYLIKVNDRNTRTRCEICSRLTIKIPER